jgi:hypothetical protein
MRELQLEIEQRDEVAAGHGLRFCGNNVNRRPTTCLLIPCELETASLRTLQSLWLWNTHTHADNTSFVLRRPTNILEKELKT